MIDNKLFNYHTIHEKPIEEIMSESFAKYAKYIIQDRAIPDIRDGLKPVQRRIIHAMNELQLYYDKPHKKSARTVGEVIGKYHPHGDSSIYDAMVRMSQSWKTNIPLLDMHGNNGSIDGDSPAAMRYTECRLSQFGQLMIENIKKDTVSFIPNFDDSEKEPTVLPTLLPNLLINGSTGIAAGYATNIPTFNPIEVIDAIIYRIDSPNCRMASLQAIMPGPDFPTGGIILNKEGITSAYETGKGKITIRAKIDLVSSKQAIISEIPYETNKAQIIKQLDELKDKYDTLNITEVRDESDKNGVSIALDLKNSHNFEFVKNFLFKNTQLQVAYAINMVAIKNRKPYLMSLSFILDAFIEHINEIVTRACQFDLTKANHRLEIVKGLIKAINLVDDVISIIKNARDKQSAILALQEQLTFSSLQAEAIVNLRLYRLSNADVSDLKSEQTTLDQTISELELLLTNKTARDNWIKNKLRNYKKLFNIKRKTQISDASDKIVIDQEDIVQNKNQVVIVTREGYLKNIPNKSYLASVYTDLKLKEGDLPICDFVSNMRDKVILFSAKGQYLSIPTHKIPTCKWKEIGVHYNNIVTANEKDVILNAFNFNNQVSDDDYVVIATKNGLIKRLLIKDLAISKNAKIASYINLQPNDEVVAVLKGSKANDNEQLIGVITKNGYLSRYPINQISIVGKNASGVKSINLRHDDQVVDIFLDDLQAEFIFIGCIQGIKRIKKDLIPITSRGNLGKLTFAHLKTNPIKALVACSLKHNEYMTYLAEDHSWNTIKATDVPIGDDQTRVSSYKNLTFVMFNKLIQPAQNEVDQAEAQNVENKNDNKQAMNANDHDQKPESLFDD